MSAQTKIQNWIKNRLEMVPAATRFELSHAPDMAEDEQILLKLEAGFSKKSDGALERARELSSQLWETADENAGAFTGRQRYKIRAFGKGDEEIATYVFAIGLGEMARAEPGDPTERGLLAQLMRHNQQLAQINVEQSQATVSALIAENRDLRGRVNHVEEQRQEWFALLEELHSEKHRRELERLQVEAAAQKQDRALQLLAHYVPEALKQLSGKKAGGHEAPQLSAKDPIEERHAIMRRVWSCLDREWVLGRLDEQNRHRIDSLLGFGEKIETVAQFDERLRLLWGSISEEVSEKIQEQILDKDPELGMSLVGLLQGETEAAQ